MSDLVKRLREYGDEPQDVSLGELAEWSHKAADRIEALEAENARLREAGLNLLRIVDEAVKEHDTADYEWGDENPWTMREWFDADDRASIEAARAALKGDT